MAEARLQAELTETKAELQRFKERFSVGTTTVHKDLSLLTVVPKWSGTETAIPLEDFISSIEGVARIGKWEDSDKLEVAILKVSDAAKQFYNNCAELGSGKATWEKFKTEFRRRFRDVRTNHQHVMKLHTMRQLKGEGARDFLDRCRSVSQKITCKANDPAARQDHYELVEDLLLASFKYGLTGVPGRQVRYSSPTTIEQALQTAISVQEAEKQERFAESFHTSFDGSEKLRSDSVSPTRHARSRPQKPADVARAVSDRPSQQKKSPRSIREAKTSGNRNAETRAALKCYVCAGLGHYARECPSRPRMESNSASSPGSGKQSERSRRSQSPVESYKPREGDRFRKNGRKQGNGREV